MDKASLFAHKEMSFFASVMMEICANFMFWLATAVVLKLHFKDQVFPAYTKVDQRLYFSLRG